MKQERFSEEKIVGILREAEKGEKPVADVCREHGVAEQTFYRWRKVTRRPLLTGTFLIQGMVKAYKLFKQRSDEFVKVAITP